MKVKINPSGAEIAQLVLRPQKSRDDLDAVIKEVFKQVSDLGDEALFYYTKLYDGIHLDSLHVSQNELDYRELEVSEKLKSAIDTAYQNIYKFHYAQMPQEIRVEISDSITCWQKPVPIDTVGLYIPGGTAPLFSTILMLAIPAKIAGCKNIILCTPPGNNGTPDVIKYAAKICGIDKIYNIGGSQAIAAMALGTESVPRVDKIFGPGNQYVTAAKLFAFQHGIGIDMPAGPSEVLVFADDSANPSYVAADLLSQAEHGEDSQVVLVTTQESILTKVKDEVLKQIDDLTRKEIAESALKSSLFIYFPEVYRAFEYVNAYAPEHLIIASDNPDKYLDLISNAGSVFVGNYTPESAGDYASGTNHTLPTGAAARSFSGVNLDAFFKKITFQRITKDGIESLGNTIIEMAKAESLDAHAKAVEIRLSNKP